MGPEIEYTAQQQDGSLDIFIYGGKDGSFTLYEDDGLTYAYEKGAYATVPMTWDDASRTFTLGARQGSYDGMFKERTVRVTLTTPDGTDKDYNAVIQYDGQEVSVKL